MIRRTCPTLVTHRLTLAPHRVEDYDDMVETWRDPVVVRYFGGVPSSPEEVWARLLRYGGMWPLVGHGFWAARETSTGRFVGEVGLAEFRRDKFHLRLFLPLLDDLECPLELKSGLKKFRKLLGEIEQLGRR